LEIGNRLSHSRLVRNSAFSHTHSWQRKEIEALHTAVFGEVWRMI